MLGISSSALGFDASVLMGVGWAGLFGFGCLSGFGWFRF